MEVFERIRFLRKQHLKMSQEQFGEALGVSRTVIKNIELDNLARPEQKEPLYRLICEKFHVNYNWLMTGEGEMLITTKQTFLEKLSTEYGLSNVGQSIIESYLNLNDEQRAGVDIFFKSLTETLAKSPTNESGTVDVAIDKTIKTASQDNDIAADIKKTIQQGESAFAPSTTQKK